MPGVRRADGAYRHLHDLHTMRRYDRLRLMAKPKQIQPVTASRKIAIGLYGNPGVGKTRLIGTSGDKTLLLRPPTDHTDSVKTAGVEEWVVRDWDDLTSAYEYLRHDGQDWDWVWLDSISLWQDHGLDDIWDNVVAEKPHRAKHGIDKGEYGVNMHRLGMWVRHMVGMQEFNFGFTAHPAELTDLDDNAVLMPYIQGKNMSNKMCGYMNLVAYLHIVKDKRVLRTQATERYYAKDQFDAFPNGRLVEPTMPKIITAIEASRNGGSKPKAATSRRTTRRRNQ